MTTTHTVPFVNDDGDVMVLVVQTDPKTGLTIKTVRPPLGA